MKNLKNAKYAYIQSGYCAFGFGTTVNAAILDAGRNLNPTEIESDDGTISYVSGKENAIYLLESARGVDGDMRIISKKNDSVEWEAYVNRS